MATTTKDLLAIELGLICRCPIAHPDVDTFGHVRTSPDSTAVKIASVPGLIV